MRIYEIPRDRVTTLESFWSVVGEVVNGPGGYFGNNLDAFADRLTGGMGTPSDGFSFRWVHHEDSERQLGYPETVRQLERRIRQAHPINRAAIETELSQARAYRGPTVFDWLVDVFREQHLPLELA